MRNLFVMFVTAVCFLFLLKLKWPRNKNIYDVRERSSGLRDNFGKSSEIFGKWSEISGKDKKRRYQYFYIIKRTLYVSSKI